MLNLPAKTETNRRRQEGGRRLSMNHSIYSADRSTHLKIVVVALVAGIAVAGFGISARTSDDSYTQTARVVKAGKAVAITSSTNSMVR
jgi:chromosome condensin MukBEF MukE localization factor